MKMRSWRISTWKTTIHVAEKVFVKGACTPFIMSLKTISVRFAIPTEVTKQMKNVEEITKRVDANDA
jgi:hypothetical protein